MVIKNVCIAHNLPHEVGVRSDQAITPAQMADLTARGRAVSMASLEQSAYYDDGLTDPEMMPLENTRGIDENILWEQAEATKEKIDEFKKNRAHNRDSYQGNGGNLDGNK